MMRFEKRRQRDVESIDRFLDNFESLRRKNFSIASEYIDALKSVDLITMLATNYNQKTTHQHRKRRDRSLEGSC